MLCKVLAQRECQHFASKILECSLLTLSRRMQSMHLAHHKPHGSVLSNCQGEISETCLITVGFQRHGGRAIIKFVVFVFDFILMAIS